MLRRWQVRAPWKLGGQYTLTIPEGAITDVAGLSNDSIIGKYTVLDPEKFATVLIHVRGRDDGTKSSSCCSTAATRSSRRSGT